MSQTGRILVADDQATFLESTVDLLREEGYECDGAADAFIAEKLVRQKRYDLLIADIKMPGNMRLELISKLREIAEGLPVILVTGYPSLDTAIKSTRLLVVGYLLKPVNFDELLKLVRESITRYQGLQEFYSAQKRQHGKKENLPSANHLASAPSSSFGKNFSPPKHLDPSSSDRAAAAVVTPDENASPTGQEDSHVFEDIIAQSALMMRVVETIKKVAPTDSDVLIIGETGAGKELVARAIHRLSLRQHAEFVPVDCVAVPSNLLESELFGHEKGAFTGAAGRKQGLLEIAHNGTLFLDEISELEINLQAKLLRVLQERQFRRVGSNELIDVNVRIIAAMNRNPRKALREGRLRQDLYYRLNVIPIRVPPLRCRREDIPLLVNHFMQLAVERYRFAPKQISPSAMELLQNYRWPGNVRQLKNVIERLMSLSPGPVIDEHDLTASIKTNNHRSNESIISLPFTEARKRKLESFEKKYFCELMKACHDDVAQAARMAGISERTIYRMMRRYGKH